MLCSPARSAAPPCPRLPFARPHSPVSFPVGAVLVLVLVPRPAHTQMLDHPLGWSGVAGGAWTRHSRRLPTRVRIRVRTRDCTKGFSLGVPSPFVLGASVLPYARTYVRAYVGADTDVAVCVWGCGGADALRHRSDPNDPPSHTRPTTPVHPDGVRPCTWFRPLGATQPPVHKAPRAVELQPCQPRVHMAPQAAPFGSR